MTVSLGLDWEQYFDVILVKNKKDLFLKSETPFKGPYGRVQ
jgi:hypothetical protein